ncbi:MAG: galactose mutarotase [Oscillospiraceae bacterium]|nr:galactose mutarotase [Oscillospiraceae bacterium]MDD4413613.1 galactose mutarotase [Oscillospiraceae bacterium]
MSISQTRFGKTSDGQAVDLFTLSNSSGMQVGILNYGGIVQFLKMSDKSGHALDLVLGFDSINEYEQYNEYFGALVGRCANRIAKGSFSLDGKKLNLNCNSKGHHLHGGNIGYSHKIWTADVEDDRLILSLKSPSGDENYPGNLFVRVTHSLSDDGTFMWDYFAQTDAKTICNLTNHSYFNLSGHNSGSVHNQVLQIEADFFTEADPELIPTGNIIDVDGTPMDFRIPHKIGQRINDDYIMLRHAGGYDHNYAVRGTVGTLRDAASCYDEQSGISFKLRTTLPGVQLYTGNFLRDVPGKGGAVYQRNDGFCLETQYFPDAVNHPSFEQPIIQPGEDYHHITTIKFETQK